MSQKNLCPTDLPLQCFYAPLPSRHSIVLHEHDSHEFFYCLEGEGLQHTDYGSIEMRPGEVFFFPAGLSHIASRVGDQPCLGAVVNVHAKSFSLEVGRDDVVNRVLDHLTECARQGNLKVELNRMSSRRMEELLKRMIEESQQRPAGFGSALRLYMQQVLLTILRAPGVLGSLREHFRPSPARERLANVFQYIETNYMNPIDVGQMAQRACISRSHFHAVFKEETGQTLVEYLNGVRIRGAMDLLRRTEMPILSISQSCGFASLSHFYHCFKNLTGQTPRAFRAKNQSSSGR